MLLNRISKLDVYTNGDFNTVLNIDNYSGVLSKIISIKFDLAETYYQLGLTYQKKGFTEQSQENFNEAIRLFKEMEAPTQVEKVQRTMELIALSI